MNTIKNTVSICRIFYPKAYAKKRITVWFGKEEEKIMGKEYAQPIRCPVCGRGGVIDAGPKAKRSKLILLTQK